MKKNNIKNFGMVTKITMYSGGEVEIQLTSVELRRILGIIEEHYSRNKRVADATKIIIEKLFKDENINVTLNALIAKHETDLNVKSKLKTKKINALSGLQKLE